MLGGRSFRNRKEPSAVGRGDRGAAKGFRIPAAHVVSVPSLIWVRLGLSDPAASVLVAVDDLHKLDAQLPSALPQLISDFSPAAVVWVLPRRTGHGGPEVERVSSLLPEPPLPHPRVAVGPLPEDTVRELTADLLAADLLGAAPPPTLAALAAAAEGNARLLIELLQGSSEDNAFTFAGGTAEVTSTALPERVHQVVRLLLAEISSRCRLFIQLAALSRKEFELGAVAEPFGQPAGMLPPLAEEATDVGVIADVGDRLASPNRCSGRPSWSRCPNRCGPGPTASPYARQVRTPASPPAPPRAPWPSSPGRPA